MVGNGCRGWPRRIAGRTMPDYAGIISGQVTLFHPSGSDPDVVCRFHFIYYSDSGFGGGVLHPSSKTSEIPASPGSGTSLEEEDLSLRTTRTVVPG